MRAEIKNELPELLPRLRAYAQILTKNSEDADDLVQTAVERALSRIDLYQPGTNFKAWMFTILRNCYFTEMRKRSRRPDTVDPMEHEGAMSVRAEQQIGLEVQDFARAFSQLSEMDRTVLILVGAEGMSYQEAANVLGTPIGTVRSRLSRARTRLKDLLGPAGVLPSREDAGDELKQLRAAGRPSLRKPGEEPRQEPDQEGSVEMRCAGLVA